MLGFIVIIFLSYFNCFGCSQEIKRHQSFTNRTERAPLARRIGRERCHTYHHGRGSNDAEDEVKRKVSRYWYCWPRSRRLGQLFDMRASCIGCISWNEHWTIVYNIKKCFVQKFSRKRMLHTWVNRLKPYFHKMSEMNRLDIIYIIILFNPCSFLE